MALTDKEAIEVLTTGKEREGSEFIRSLLANYDKKGRLSDKQWYWVHKMANEALVPPAPREVVAHDLGASFAKIIFLFKKAKVHLKYPSIRLATSAGPVVLKVAGDASKYTGQVHVTNGGPYGANTYYGRIMFDGKLAEGKGVPPIEMNAVLELLKDFATDPVKVASEYGRLNGVCCFCNSKLTDERSTAVGYGPICAEHYGLDWGSKKHMFASSEEMDYAREAGK